MIALDGRFALAHDAVAIAISNLPETMQRATDAGNSDVIWTQTRSRVSSMVVGPEAAALLQTFQDPIGIAEAVVRFGKVRAIDASEVLRSAYPLIREAVNRGLLVRESEWKASRADPRLSTGQTLGRWTIVRCLQSLLDGEVYEAREGADTQVALKVARVEKAATRLRREARALGHLDRHIGPRLIEIHEHDGSTHLAIEWIQGQSPAVVAEHLRAAGQVTRTARIRLACGILETYAALHRQGVVHGDVHPMNMIVERDGRVRLLDFEYAGIPGGPPPERGGVVAYYLEPEAALEMVRSGQPRSSSPLGEQFALGALLFELFTGQHYLDFQLEPERFLRQVCSDPPRAFTDCGVNAWPEVEALLRRALEKNPADRFPSVGDFLAGFRQFAERPKVRHATTRSHRRWLKQRMTDLVPGSEWFKHARTEPPFSSLYYGLTGPAMVHLRLAGLRSDADHLAAADCWCAQAEYLTSKRDAYANAEIRAAGPRVSRSALLHGPLGVALTRAAIAHARCDDREVSRASQWFRQTAEVVPRNPDLTLGKSGVLLGAATLLRIASLSAKERSAVRRLGRGTLDTLVKWAHDAGGPVGTRWPNLGMAHGWAGILYAMLQWCEADRASRLPAAAPEWLDALASLGERSGKGMRWPWQQAEHRRTHVAGYALGWCNGSAGFVELWSAAHRVLRRPEDLQRLEGAAWDTAHSDSGLWSLCCGSAGRAFALLTAARATGDSRWIRRARHLADRAIVVREEGVDTGSNRHSLFRGDAGLALLLAEMEQPTMARFPVMDPH